MFKYFLLLIFRPKKTIPEIIRAEIKIRGILFFLLSLGILRGVLEVIWIFAIKHRLREILVLSKHLSWWYLECGPFILSAVFSAYFRWAMYSAVFYLALKFFKIKVDFAKVLKVFSVILGLYVLTILINFLHCFFNLGMVKFYLSQFYSPVWGIGQIISAFLLIWLIYNLGLSFGLDKISSLLVAVLVLGIDRIFYFFSARAYFRLPLISIFPYKKIFYLANYLTALVSIILTLFFLWIGYRINGQKKTSI